MGLLIDTIEIADRFFYIVENIIELLLFIVVAPTFYIIEKCGVYVGLIIVLLLTILSFNAETVASIMKHQWNVRSAFFSRMLHRQSHKTAD